MSLIGLEEIQKAIVLLTPQEQRELLGWIEESISTRFDARIQSDMDAGRLDSLIDGALQEQKEGRVRPL